MRAKHKRYWSPDKRVIISACPPGAEVVLPGGRHVRVTGDPLGGRAVVRDLGPEAQNGNAQPWLVPGETLVWWVGV